MRNLAILLTILAFFACNKDNNDGNPPPTETTPNILLIIADDMGKDATSGFSEGSIKPNTPNLDKIRNEGLVFDNFWVYPTCSPTRASIITGKYGYRTNVKWANDGLDLSEKTLHEYIREETNNAYATALIGKWHLSGENETIDPASYGLGYYAGLTRGGVQDYYNWQLTENGNGSLENEYTSKVFTDLSIDWINSQDKSWFLWLAFNAPHTPFHAPPSEMHSQGNLADYTDGLDPMPYYMAAIEAMDYQIGKLLESIPEDELDNTLIIFMGDNGTPNQVAQAPFSNTKVKGSLYQGGVNVPMFVSGAGVSRIGSDENLICSTDLFSTIAELTGASNPNIVDSKSFKQLLSGTGQIRNYQYSEKYNEPDDLWAISNGEYKLIVNANGAEEMYNLLNDPYENTNLLNTTLSTVEENAKTDLEAELQRIRD